MPRPPRRALPLDAQGFAPCRLGEALGLSAVLTMVAYALTLGRLAPERIGARQRRAAYAVWEVAVFVLNVLAFVLVGLQLRGILERLDGDIWRYVGFALAVLAVAVAVRVAWVLGYHAAARWTDRHFGAQAPRWPMPPPTARGAIVVAWCGMRGIVTLAAALALPVGFPGRDLIVFAAFGVVLGTLVVQGLTLRPLLSRLALPRDESVEQEVSLARGETARAALGALAATAGKADRDGEARHLLERAYRARLAACGRPGGGAADPTGLGALRRVALAAERARLVALPREERIGDDAFHQVEEELDWAEAEVMGRAAEPESADRPRRRGTSWPRRRSRIWPRGVPCRIGSPFCSLPRWQPNWPDPMLPAQRPPPADTASVFAAARVSPLRAIAPSHEPPFWMG